jgi:DNA-binding transcriptional regulator YdaS (Cro superfamily)
MERPPIIDEAIRAAGGGAAIARELGLKSRQAVYQWTRIPAEHCPVVERMSGIPRHRLRPDLWPAPQAAE